MAGGGRPGEIPRRSFVKYAAVGGLAAFGAYSGLVYPSGWRQWLEFGRKPWELAPGVVDYEIVKEKSWGPAELGFANDIRNSPPEARILSVAQWYDYWPGSVLRAFSAHMARTWDVSGVRISWTSNIYTSNDELFTWITQTGRKFDVMFPSDSPVQAMEKAGQLANMNKEWIPNYVNMFGKVPTTWPDRFERTRAEREYQAQPAYPEFPNGYNNTAAVDFRDPAVNGYAYRMNRDVYPEPRGSEDFTWDEENSLLAVPYQWGTTGIGYRTDIFRKEDIEKYGWEVFELTSYTNPEWLNPETGQREVRMFDLSRKKMLLDDMREAFGVGHKAVGWKRQLALEDAGRTTAAPTAIAEYTGPTVAEDGTSPATPATYAESPFDGDYQWSYDEVADDKLQASADWLTSLPNMWGFNTPQQGPFLTGGVMYVDEAWSGDIMYAVRPASSNPPPVDYFVPKQGMERWLDNAVLHRESEKLWLSHEFINFLCDGNIGAIISNWNFYASPNAWSFQLLAKDPAYTYSGVRTDGQPYVWNPAADERIYADIALGMNGVPMPGGYLGNGGKPILERCEYTSDVGVRNSLRYFSYWRQVKF